MQRYHVKLKNITEPAIKLYAQPNTTMIDIELSKFNSETTG